MKFNFRNFGLWLAIGFNLFLLTEYFFDNGNAKNVVLLFWVQSILAGLENIAKILFSRGLGDKSADDSITVQSLMQKVFLAGFFTIHYGIFVLVLGAMAVFSDKLPGDMFHSTWVYPTLLLLCVGTLIDLPQKIIETRKKGTNAIILMFIPYIRLVPFIAIFLGQQYLLSQWLFPMFLVLKLGIDVFYYKYVDNVSEDHLRPSASV